MSIIIGVVLGALICWYAKKNLWLEEVVADSVKNRPDKAVVLKPVTVLPEAQKRSNRKAKSTTVTKKKTTRKVKKTSPPTASKSRSAKQAKKDDLKKINGIGPKIAEILNKDGVITFKQLSKTKPTELKKILDKAGSRYRASDLPTWSKQAKFADIGDWAAAKAVWNTPQTTATK